LTVTVNAGASRSVYEIRMLRESVNDLRIKKLAFNGITLMPGFASNVFEYSASVHYNTSEISYTIEKFNTYANTVTYVNNVEITSDSIPLAVGENIIKIECISPLGAETCYTFKKTPRTCDGRNDAP
jgi:hypothetical protein